MTHALINDTLVVERDTDGNAKGIVAHCICGWSSRPHFTSMTASCAFQDHLEANGCHDRYGRDSE